LNVETSVNVAGLLIVLAIVVSAQNDLPPPQWCSSHEGLQSCEPLVSYGVHCQ